MHVPNLNIQQEIHQTMDLFLGLNHNLRIRPGEFYDMENLSSDLFPVLSPRKPRGILKTEGKITGLTARDGLCYVEGENLYLNGKRLDLQLSADPAMCEKQLISMGAWLIILPDKKYINMKDLSDFGSIENTVTTASPVVMVQCSLDGREIVPQYAGPSAPENPADQSYWVDYAGGTLKQYSSLSAAWVLVETPFVKLSCPGIGRGFSPFDGIYLSGDPGLNTLSGAAILYDCKEDFVIIPGLIPEKTTLTQPLTLERSMPLMDFCIESGNRLWGCRYGENSQGQVVNEIYCSKLGDFKNWNCYMGISTDSYTASLGSEGPFTGAIAYGGHPLFFKEDSILKVFGSQPSDFSVMTTGGRGVQQGSQASLQIVRELLFYKAPGAVCCYDGSSPRDIGEALGKEEFYGAAAGSLNGKYYISMGNDQGHHLFVYDTVKNLWHREDTLHALMFARARGELYCVDSSGRLLSLTGTAGEREPGPVAWMARSGLIGVTLPGNKYLSRLNLRMRLEPGTYVTVSVRYDSLGPFEILGTAQGMSLRSFSLPVVPRRCDNFELKIEGRGPGLIFAADRVIKPGSTAVQ